MLYDYDFLFLFIFSMTGSLGRQFLMLLWKNFKIQRHRKVATAFQIIIPVLFSVILLVLRLLVRTFKHSMSIYMNES